MVGDKDLAINFWRPLSSATYGSITSYGQKNCPHAFGSILWFALAAFFVSFLVPASRWWMGGRSRGQFFLLQILNSRPLLHGSRPVMQS